MKKKTFKPEVLDGHKEAAVEVPFDPALTWGIARKPLWRGRKGHEVKGKLNGLEFQSFSLAIPKRPFLTVGLLTREEQAGCLRPHAGMRALLNCCAPQL